MKLLFDHNLSPRLVDRLVDLFPGLTHLYTLGMDRQEDREVWI
jgi:predicted nuclease of predicted toxin-antitoxin system